jgi:hypothetical protein
MVESEQGKMHTSVSLYFQLNWKKGAIKGEVCSKVHVYFTSVRNSTIPRFVCVQLEVPGIPFRVFLSKDETPLLDISTRELKVMKAVPYYYTVLVLNFNRVHTIDS